ncbi:hypothetical protein [Spiroplasma monobiae]|uniref:Transmembrane protein n=1 Tax=Spiroplasma monobiae MQ-1 TaxID=1336748 RepID=A0A2K9LTA5_SPISQ|nr:hypothetical protein [Spiroplasma monobiae]AUM62326.1 hypothetical protein SMONO_v1c00730 [Spiroplasma monobiae MQ-1]
MNLNKIDQELFFDLKNAFEGDRSVMGAARALIIKKIITIIGLTLSVLALFSGLILLFLGVQYIGPENIVTKIGIVLLILSIFLLPIFLILMLLGLERSSKKLNEAINEKGKLPAIYKSFYSSKKELKDAFNFNLKLVNTNPSPKKIYSQFHQSYLSSLTPPIYNRSLNSLDFIFNDKIAKFQIQQPLIFSSRRRTMRNSTVSYKRKEIKVSMDVLYMDHSEFQTIAKNLRIKKAKVLKGEYRSESVEFNNKYSTNIPANHIGGAKFLSPVALDTLANINDNNFFDLGIFENIYVEKVFMKKQIAPVGLFDFTKLKSKKSIFELMSAKMHQEYEMLKLSMAYLSFVK